MTKAFSVLRAVLFLLMTSVLLAGAPVRAQDALPPDRILGKADAPITIYEYASLTCSHCADFNKTVLPEIEKRYIETGKARLIFRDYPLDGTALKAAVMVRCMPADQFYPFIRVLYNNLEQWAFSKNPEQTILQYAKLGGLAEDKAQACLKDTKKLDAVVAARTQATDKYGIDSTPTFVISGNGVEEKIVGAKSADEFGAVIDKIVANKK